MEEEHELAIASITEERDMVSEKLKEVTRRLIVALTDDATFNRARSAMKNNLEQSAQVLHELKEFKILRSCSPEANCKPSVA